MDNQNSFNPQTLLSLIKNIRFTLEVYNELKNVVVSSDSEFIADMIEDDKNHEKLLGELYFNLTGQKVNLDNLVDNKVNKETIIKDLFKYKYSLYKYYKNLYTTTNHVAIKNLLMDLIDDTSDHLMILNFLSYKQVTPRNKKVDENYWLDYIYWFRSSLVSTANNLHDKQETNARLIHCANNISRTFPAPARKQVDDLLTEHMIIGINLIQALKDGNSHLSINYYRDWTKNAQSLANALHQINRKYQKDELLMMLEHQLDLMKKDITWYLEGDYTAEISNFDHLVKEVLKFSQYLKMNS